MVLRRRRSSPGGQSGARGYVVQALIGLLEALSHEPPFQRFTVEPAEASDKVDLLFEGPNGRTLIQVKASATAFTNAKVKRWASELASSSRKGDECVLCLV